MTVLIADDEAGYRSGVRKLLELSNHRIEEAASADAAAAVVEAGGIDLVLLDQRLGRDDGLELLPRLLGLARPPSVVMVTGYGDMGSAVEAMRRGASNYLTKPLDAAMLASVLAKEEEALALKRENRVLRTRIGLGCADEIVRSALPALREVDAIVERVADTDAPVLILGETGTGKEIVARRIHTAGRWTAEPFVGLNCAAVNENLLESELFGHEKGSFTGAFAAKKGRFELAGGGTLFMDEVGDMSLPMQAKLLRVLEERSYERLGGTRPLPMRCRIISATNRDLSAWIADGRFRSDLYYRLGMIKITLPPLRERREDIPAFVDMFLRQANERYGRGIRNIAPEAMASLQAYDWPGNVRELKNVLTRAVLMSADDILKRFDLAAPPAYGSGFAETESPFREAPTLEKLAAVGLKALVERENGRMERGLISAALAASGGNMTKTAALLKVTRKTLYDKMRAYDL